MQSKIDAEKKHKIYHSANVDKHIDCSEKMAITCHSCFSRPEAFDAKIILSRFALFREGLLSGDDDCMSYQQRGNRYSWLFGKTLSLVSKSGTEKKPSRDPAKKSKGVIETKTAAKKLNNYKVSFLNTYNVDIIALDRF